MSPRAEIAAGAAVLLLLGIGAGLLGSRQHRGAEDDARRSTFVAGPRGASAYAEALGALGVRVERFRRRSREAGPLAGAGALFAVLDPAREPERTDVAGLRAWLDGGGALLLAGKSTEAVMRCYGYAVEERRDSTASRLAAGGAPIWLRAVLVRAAAVPDSSGPVAGAPACDVAEPVAVDTLLLTPGNRVGALRLTLDGGRGVILVADGRVFGNRALRETGAGEFALGLVAGRYERAVFDEYHQGYGAGGSLFDALMAWSTSSPWGWASWQLALVGVLALAAGGVRFGPPRSVIDRRRRSPLEHVRALATALSSAGGHDVAVTLILQGLRRRLSGRRQPLRDDPGPWLDTLAEHVRTPRGRAALARLQQLTASRQPAEGVLAATFAVEDVWEELKPRAPHQ
jgi:hypothetical protein